MNKLKKLRKEFNMSLNDVGNMLNITRQAVSYWELGKTEPNIKTLIKLADYFNVSVDYLIGRSDER